MLGSPNQTANQIRRSYNNDVPIKYFRDSRATQQCNMPPYAYAVTDYEQSVQDSSSGFLLTRMQFTG